MVRYRAYSTSKGLSGGRRSTILVALCVDHLRAGNPAADRRSGPALQTRTRCGDLAKGCFRRTSFSSRPRSRISSALAFLAFSSESPTSNGLRPAAEAVRRSKGFRAGLSAPGHHRCASSWPRRSNFSVLPGSFISLCPQPVVPSFVIVVMAVFVGLVFAAALVSNAPGGLGVFELALHQGDAEQRAAPEVQRARPHFSIFRLLYLLIPLAFALLVVLMFERAQARRSAAQADRRDRRGDGRRGVRGAPEIKTARPEGRRTKRKTLEFGQARYC